MGQANKQRRRAKEKARKRPKGGREARGASFWGPEAGLAAQALAEPTVEQLAAEAMIDARTALLVGDRTAFEAVSRRLATGDGRPSWRPAVERALLAGLRDLVGQAWRRAWEPADLLRVVDREVKGAQPLRLVRGAIASELRQYPASTIDERWHAQLAEHSVTQWWAEHETFLHAAAQDHPQGWVGVVTDAMALIVLLDGLPTLEAVSARPGTASPSTATAAAGVDERVLAKVRALLAKAESTTYPAEAETFTAGAQALMARHSIDHAVLAATEPAAADEPAARRIGLDPPYEAAKVTLLDAVCRANRCRVVWSKALGFCTVVGFPTDLDAVELLFTSLLVQATTTMTSEGSRTDRRTGRSRTRSFRQSFLVSYADRVGERLAAAMQEQTAEAVAEAGHRDLLPVLAAREDQVSHTVTELFPAMTETVIGGASDPEGWASGRAAADRADLARGRAVE